jgi:hypothetical protein
MMMWRYRAVFSDALRGGVHRPDPFQLVRSENGTIIVVRGTRFPLILYVGRKCRGLVFNITLSNLHTSTLEQSSQSFLSSSMQMAQHVPKFSHNYFSLNPILLIIFTALNTK